MTVDVGGRQVRVGSFPISIDYEAFSRRAASPEVTQQVNWLTKSMLYTRVVLGADRLDYTKGLPERLMAYRNALERYPDLRGKLTLVQVVVPSREQVAEYQSLKAEVERLVGEINGRFTSGGWIPIHYMYRNLDMNELLAYYRLADIALVTPLKDGMNLVAKEYCASNIDENGVLILSEFAGAAAQMHRDALLVNPYDIEGVADAIHRAFVMEESERTERMHRMRDQIRRNDIFRWVDSYLQAAFAIHLDNIPPLEEYVPEFKFNSEVGG
jgi:trehalose 6-phosphate synthase